LTEHGNTAHYPMGLRLVRRNAHVHNEISWMPRSGKCTTSFTCFIHRTKIVGGVLNFVFFTRY
jgi:hypothetical protein